MQIGTGKSCQNTRNICMVRHCLDSQLPLLQARLHGTVISIGLFNSIMFPNIFTLAVKDLDNAELSGASGLINSLIVGGALIPPIMGGIADNFGYTWAFLVPALCYIYILFYSLKGSTIRRG